MITRNEALQLIRENVKNENIVRHMIALEVLMGGVWQDFKDKGKNEEELGGSKEEWMMAGLLHDGDYTEDVDMKLQGIEITKWARERGHDIPQNVAHAMASHNWHNTGVEPTSLMDWTIFCGDTITGLIVASTLVLPTKKLSDLTVESVLKKFKTQSFARGARRDDILLCEEKLGISLEKFIAVSLSSMQKIAQEIGL